MKKGTTTKAEIVRFRQDVQSKLRQRVREAIETVLDEELAEALGGRAVARCPAILTSRAASRLGAGRLIIAGPLVVAHDTTLRVVLESLSRVGVRTETQPESAPQPAQPVAQGVVATSCRGSLQNQPPSDRERKNRSAPG